MLLLLNVFRYAINISSNVLRCTLGLAICVTVISCGSLVEQPSNSNRQSAEDLRLAKLSPRARVREYDRRATQAIDSKQRAYYQLLSIESLLEFGNAAVAKKRLKTLDLRALEDEYSYRVDLINAQLALADNKAPVALQKLPLIQADYPLPIQTAILRTRAMALSRQGYQLESLQTRLALDKVLSAQLPEKTKAQVSNHQVIWSILQAMPTDLVNELPKEQAVLNGWAELALNIRAAQQAGMDRNLAVSNWSQRFPTHPATNTLAKTLSSSRNFISEYPNSLAILLPLSGRLAPQASAIREGLLSAYFKHDSANRPQLRIYDTGDKPQEVWTHYQEALKDGAEMIVGPLHKLAVTELVNASSLSLPVLALNYPNDSKLVSNNVVQFGLLPEDEARQAAELAIIKDQINTIIFAPTGSYGDRVSTAFADRYKELGGQVLAIERYSANADDHGSPIQRALNIQQSKNRHSILRTVLKRDLKFEPRRRQDVEVVFLVANPRHARNFRSQLKFHNAGNTPIYSTSQTFSGSIDTRSDRDLNGIVFTDMPWTLQGALNTDYQTAAKYWPKSLQKYSRLYALGIDAYRIIPYLAKLRSDPYQRFPGLTGGISLNADNKIHRELLWATFNDGRPEVMEFTSLEAQDLLDSENEAQYLD